MSLSNIDRVKIYLDEKDQKESYAKLSDIVEQDGCYVNVYGVVSSFTQPKRCSARASHKYCTSISVIDPSLSRPSESVCVNWFINESSFDIRIGDIVRCHNIRIQKYNNYPQLTGNPDKSRMAIFRHNRDFLTGLPAKNCNILLSSDSTAPLSTCNSSSSSSRPIFANTHHNKHSKNPNSTDDIALRDAFQQSGEWTSFSHFPNCRFQPRDVQIIAMLTEWMECMFTFTTLSDNVTPQSSLHSVLTHIHRKIQSSVYSTLTPGTKSNLYPAVSIPTDRCDVVCMVVESLAAFSFSHVDSSSSSINGSDVIRLILWDGTTNGMLTLSHQAKLPSVERIHAALHSSNEYSRCRSPEDLRKAKQTLAVKPTSSSTVATTYLGTGLEARAADSSLNSVLSQFGPGMWVRIRNLYLSEQTTYVTIKADTHVCLFYPYFHDVTILTRTYYWRLMNHFVATAHSATANTTSNNSSSTFDHPHITSTGAVMTIKGRKTTSVSSAATSSAKHTVTASNANGKVTNKRKVNISANGESYTPLVLALVKQPLPFKICSWARILDWFPKNVAEFLITVANEDLFNFQSTSKEQDEEIPPNALSSSVVKAKHNLSAKNSTTTTTSTISCGSSKQLCFGLRIADETAEADVIIHGADAEYFLDKTAREFGKNQNDLQQHIENRLKQCQKNEVVLDFYLRCFTQNDGEDTADEEMQQGSFQECGNKPRNNDVNDGGDLVRRLQVFNTKLPL